MTATASRASVHTVSRYTIQCANEASVTSLGSLCNLGPLDTLVFPFVPIENVFVYRKLSTSYETKLLPIERLRQPHLTGRLQMNSESHAPEIVRLGTGVELHEARCDLRLDDLVPLDRTSDYVLVTDLPNCGTALVPPFDPTLEAVCRDPLLAIQHTRFACGSVVLGIRVHHIVCDAGGYFQLVRDIAEVYRGLSSSSHPTLQRVPQIRSYLQDTSILSRQQRHEALDYKPTAYYSSWHAMEKSSKPPITGRVLRFTGDLLQDLKRLATEPSGKNWVSTFEALSAYLYQLIYRARAQLLLSQGVPPTEVSKQLLRGFWASIDMRDSRRLNLGPNYFPNAIYPPYRMVAKALHELIRAVDVQQMEKTTRWIAVQPDKSRIRVGFTFVDGNFTISQWSRFKMYVSVEFDADGDGNPVHPILVAPPFTEISRVDALAMILSTDGDLVRAAEQEHEQFRKYYR
ncbi:transferase [Aspergillus granulosus]|uniref:Transferase n=1 Tax=Aspergillus granulosus TaxID=176169 RepID=A0ABR4HIX3_9EURO